MPGPQGRKSLLSEGPFICGEKERYSYSPEKISSYTCRPYDPRDIRPVRFERIIFAPPHPPPRLEAHFIINYTCSTWRALPCSSITGFPQGLMFACKVIHSLREDGLIRNSFYSIKNRKAHQILSVVFIQTNMAGRRWGIPRQGNALG